MPSYVRSEVICSGYLLRPDQTPACALKEIVSKYQYARARVIRPGALATPREYAR